MLAEVLGIVLGTVMFVAGLGKLVQGEGLRHTLTQYAQVFGWPATWRVFDLVATTLPWLQIFLGAALLRGILVQSSATLVGLMLLAFAGIQFYALHRRQTLECGCFGLLVRGPVRPFTVARDVALALLALALVSQT